MGIFIVRMFFEKVCTTNVNLTGFSTLFEKSNDSENRSSDLKLRI
jgi:hypothetical protein